MASHSPSDGPLQELKHDAVPGYPKAFAIAFAVMGIYLVAILFTSPGQVEHGHHDDHDKHGDSHAAKPSEHGDHAEPATDEKHHDGKKSKSH